MAQYKPLTRRQVLEATSAALLAKQAIAFQSPASGITVEQQKGDPDLRYEQVKFDPETIRKATVRHGRAVFEKWDSMLPANLIAVARSFLGCSRTSTPEQITEFLGLFGLPLRDQDGYVAFCAAGLSFCALMAYAKFLSLNIGQDKRIEQFRKISPDLDHYYFYPTVSCIDMYHIAAGKRRWVDRKASPTVLPSPGWIVLFDWGKRGTQDHCGIVQQATRDRMTTIEFNTSGNSGDQRNGGAVAEKQRNYDFVAGYIVTDRQP